VKRILPFFVSCVAIKETEKGEVRRLYAHNTCSTEILKPENGIIDIIKKTVLACSG